MKVTIKFSRPVGNQVVQFTATFSPGGIGSYEFWGQKCYDSHIELDEIAADTEGLTREFATAINQDIENGEFDQAAWDALRDAEHSHDAC